MVSDEGLCFQDSALLLNPLERMNTECGRQNAQGRSDRSEMVNSPSEWIQFYKGINPFMGVNLVIFPKALPLTHQRAMPRLVEINEWESSSHRVQRGFKERTSSTARPGILSACPSMSPALYSLLHPILLPLTFIFHSNPPNPVPINFLHTQFYLSVCFLENHDNGISKGPRKQILRWA